MRRAVEGGKGKNKKVKKLVGVVGKDWLTSGIRSILLFLVLY